MTKYAKIKMNNLIGSGREIARTFLPIGTVLVHIFNCFNAQFLIITYSKLYNILITKTMEPLRPKRILDYLIFKTDINIVDKNKTK